MAIGRTDRAPASNCNLPQQRVHTLLPKLLEVLLDGGWERADSFDPACRRIVGTEAAYFGSVGRRIDHAARSNTQ